MDATFRTAANELAHAVVTLAARASDRTGRVLTIAGDAPDTFEKLCAHHAAQTDTLTVWSGGSDATIYPDHETNYAFRFWHDLDGHLRHGLSFTPEDETRVQTHHHLPTLRAMGLSDNALRIYAADTIGQIEYVNRWQRFPDDQLGFVSKYVSDPDLALTTVF